MSHSTIEALNTTGNSSPGENLSPRQAGGFSANGISHRIGVSLSPHVSTFAPLLYAGRLEEGLKAAAKCGFSAVEISLRKAEDVDETWLASRLSDLGLVVSALATGRMCLEDSMCFCDTNPVIRQQLRERFTVLIRQAARFNAAVIIGGVRGKLSGNEQQKSDQYLFAVDTLRQCAYLASQSEVNLLIEPINRYETNFVNTALDGLNLINAIGYPCVKLLLDTFHMNIEEVDPCQAIRTAGDQLGYIHFADSNRHAPGKGHINFMAILAALKEIGYQGVITAEILPIPDDAQAMLYAGQYLHAMLVNPQKGK